MAKTLIENVKEAIHNFTFAEALKLLQTQDTHLSSCEIQSLLISLAQTSNRDITAFVRSENFGIAEYFYDFEQDEYKEERKKLMQREAQRIKIAQLLLLCDNKNNDFDQKDKLAALLISGGLKIEQMQIKETDEIIQEILELNQTAYDVAIRTILVEALAKKDPKIITLLLSRLKPLTPEQLNTPDTTGTTLLMFAVGYRSYEMVKYLLPQLTPEQISVQNKNGLTALMGAVRTDPVQFNDFDFEYEDENLQKVDIRILEAILHAGLTAEQIMLQDNSFKTALGYATDQEVRNLIISRLKELGSTLDHNEPNAKGWTPLMMAAQEGHEDIIKNILDNELTPEQIALQNKDGATALMLATVAGHKNIVKMLLQTGLTGEQISIQDCDGNTVLMEAIKWTDWEDVVSCLLSKLSPEQITLQNNVRENALEIAQRQDSQSIINMILNAGLTLDQLNVQDAYGYTALMRAIYLGDIKLIKQLLAKGLTTDQINVKNNDGFTALMIALKKGDEKITSLLLNVLPLDQIIKEQPELLIVAAEVGDCSLVNKCLHAGIDVNIQDNEGNTAVMKAAESGHIEIVKHLITFGADVTLQNNEGNTALIKALKNYSDQEKCKAIIELLLNTGLSEDHLNLKDSYGETALTWAISYNYQEIVTILCNKLTPKSLLDICPKLLLDAAGEGYITIIHTLIQAGVNVNARDNIGRTALHQAAGAGHEDIVDCLIKAGGDVNCLDNIEITPLMEAAGGRYPNPSIVKRLIEAGAKVNTQNNGDFTPLMMAAVFGSYEIVKQLIEAGADVALQDNMGRTALMSAAEAGHISIVKLLLTRLTAEQITKQNKFGEDVFSTYYFDDDKEAEIKTLIKNKLKEI